MKYNFAICIAILLSLSSFAQAPTKWKTYIEQQKVFIENKSQFDGLLTVPHEKMKLQDSEILFGTDEGPAMILFTKNGLSYRFEQIKRKQRDEKESAPNNSFAERREKEDHAFETMNDVVHMQWENCNPDVEIIPTEPVITDFNYSKDGKGINHVKAYRKLMYKELYPHIDVVYVYPFLPDSGHRLEGIEYSLILHPGADISQVKMKYSNVNHISIDPDGHVHLPTAFGDITDHAPVTTYTGADNSIIRSHFVKNGKSISFELENYDRAQTVIIDPWTATPALPTTNKVYYIKSDANGNAYILGGESPICLQKYDSMGTPIWNYSTAWIGGNFSLGALATDRNGNCYISNGGGATITKIDSAGSYSWSVSLPSSPFDPAVEFWAMDLNCSGTELYIGGSRHDLQISLPPAFSFHGAIFKMKLSNRTISGFVNVVNAGFGFTLFNINEVRSLRAAPNGNVYYLTLDTVGAIAPNLHILQSRLSGYHFPYYMPYSAGNGSDGQGQNNIGISNQFIYSTNGEILHKRDIINGNILKSDTIPFGSANNNSGVAIDSCGNVYVGSQNRVVKYDADLNFISFASTPEPVYDVSIGANGDVLACGHHFAVAMDMSACTQYKPDCCSASAQINSDRPIICAGDSVHICALEGLASYQWNTGQTTACIEAKDAGNYYVTVSDGGSCTATSNHLSFSVFPAPPVSISTNGDTLTAYNSASYQWFLNGQIIADATSDTYITQQPGNYSVVVSDSNGCSAHSTEVEIISGITNLSLDEGLKVYPNPLESGRWNLECGIELIGRKVEVFDNNGRLVYKSEIKNQKSEISQDLVRGIYLMKISSERKQTILKLIRL